MCVFVCVRVCKREREIETERDRDGITYLLYLHSQGTTLFSTLMLCFVMLWLMYYLIQKWNNKLIKETLKSAI